MDLRVLARKLEKSSDDLLISASKKSPEIFQKVSTAIAAASTLLEGVADDMDNNASFDITPNQLDEIAALAASFDESGDPLLKKQASVLDELLLSIAAPKNAVAMARKATEDEINRLREERRKSVEGDLYQEPRQRLSKMNNAVEQAKAVEQQVKKYVPLEAPLQTRYPPDRPGGQMTRIADGVYQDTVTGIIYDYKAGYKTQKGNEIPGTAVEYQTRDFGDKRDQGMSLFETRESLMGRYASDGVQQKIAVALKAIRDYAPSLLESAIDGAHGAGFSTDQVANILASDVSDATLKAFAEDKKKRSLAGIRPLTLEESEQEYQAAERLLQPLAELVLENPQQSSLWLNIIRDNIDSLSLVGMHPVHLVELVKRFAPQLEIDAPTLPPKRNTLPVGTHDAFSTTLHANTKRQGLVALALSAIQELAPHLLKSAVSKAQSEGLTDQQIKSIISSDFVNKFQKSTDEIRVAEVLLPQLKALGWNDLANQHIKVMASLGVSNNDIRKVTAGVTEFSADDLGEPLSLDLDEPSKSVQPNIQIAPLQEENEPEPTNVTAQELNALAAKTLVNIKEMLIDPNEYQSYKTRKRGKELLEVVTYSEIQKFRDVMADEMFSAFAALVQQLVNANPELNKLIESTTVKAPLSPFVVPKPRMKKEEPVRIGPEDDLEGWNKVYDEAFDIVEPLFIPGGKLFNELQDLNSKDPKKAESLFYTALDEIMHEKGFIGSHDIHSSGMPYSYVAEQLEAAKKRKIQYGPWNPKAKEPELTRIKGESEDDYAKRKARSKVKPPTADQLELGTLVPGNKPELSDSKPAENTPKMPWGDLQKRTGKEISEARANELEQQIDDNISAENSKLDEIFNGIDINVETMPQSINLLPTEVKDKVIALLGSGESTSSVQKYLHNQLNIAFIKQSVNVSEIENKSEVIVGAIKELLDKGFEAATKFLNKNSVQLKTQEPAFTLPSSKDIQSARARLLGPKLKKKLDELRKNVRKIISRRNKRKVLESAGFKAIPEDEEDKITFDQIKQTVDDIMGGKKFTPPKVAPIPTGPDGEKLTTFWEDPSGYMAAYKSIKEKYPERFKKDEVQRNHQDDAMVAEGYVSLDEPLFGWVTSRQMLRNVKSPDEVLPDFTNPKTQEPYKTLFSNPDEYMKAYFDAKKLFKTDWRPQPKEWFDIQRGDLDISDIPSDIKDKALLLAKTGMNKAQIYQEFKVDDATAKRTVLDKSGNIEEILKTREYIDRVTEYAQATLADMPVAVKELLLPMAVKFANKDEMAEAIINDPKIPSRIKDNPDEISRYIERIKEYAGQSGERFRRKVMSLAFSGVPFQDAQETLQKEFPEIKPQWDVVEYVFDNYKKDKEESVESQNKQVNWLNERGFYSPYKAAVGGINEDKSGKGRYMGEPVTFASIISRKYRGGTRDSDPDAVPLTSLKSKVNGPNWSAPTGQRQPGTSAGSTKALAPFVRDMLIGDKPTKWDPSKRIERKRKG